MTSRRRRFFALLAACIAGLAACGISADGDPQAIAPEDVPFSLLDPDLSTSTTEASGGQSSTFFLVRTSEDGTFLEEVTRDVESPTPSNIIATLLELQPDEKDSVEAELTTKIPEGTTLLAATLDDESNVLALNFSENLLTVEGPGQTGLFAQIVCTATEIDGVDRVSFEIDGEPGEALDGGSESTSEPLDCTDYPSFRAPSLPNN